MAAFLNPWVILAGVLALAGAGAYGVHVGRGLEIAAHAKEKSLEERIQQTLAQEVSKIRVVNKTIQGKVETITRENTVYRDCHHDPATLGLLNDILTGKVAEPTGGSVVPAADAAP